MSNLPAWMTNAEAPAPAGGGFPAADAPPGALAAPGSARPCRHRRRVVSAKEFNMGAYRTFSSIPAAERASPSSGARGTFALEQAARGTRPLSKSAVRRPRDLSRQPRVVLVIQKVVVFIPTDGGDAEAEATPPRPAATQVPTAPRNTSRVERARP